MDLHLQALVDGTWQRAAVLEFPEPAAGPSGACNIEYDEDYVVRWIGAERPQCALSVHLPVALGPVCRRRWPAFLDDLRPMGAARSWWLRRLSLPSEARHELELLRRGTIAPVGNLRIEEAVPVKRGPPSKFPRQAVVSFENEFLEHAADSGAQVGGATGAGGDSPKLLLRQNDANEVWIDVWQDEPELGDRHYLVKFARGSTERHRTILRSEHAYYRTLHSLGVSTVAVDAMSLEEGPSGPSLWLPRFDVARQDGKEVRFGLESIYSLVGGAPGSFQTHQTVLAALKKVVRAEEWASTLAEYLKRDLLNWVFGNSDNHGRNTALLKTDSGIQLAPVYDFAPMKMDPDGITRTTRWEGFELGGEVDWTGLLRSFGRDEERLREELRALCSRLRDLPDRLKAFGLPEETLEFPGIGFRRTEQKLAAWGLR